MPRDREPGVRLEKAKHIAAEKRVKEALERGIPDYEGKDADLELIRRKHRELSRRRMARVIQREL
jgi:hypothetical protein